jgi:hypothetical protein
VSARSRSVSDANFRSFTFNVRCSLVRLQYMTFEAWASRWAFDLAMVGPLDNGLYKSNAHLDAK